MSGTDASRMPLASYRTVVSELVETGWQFGDVEDVIDEVAELSQDEKAALWLFAYSLQESSRAGARRAQIAVLQ